MRPLFKCLSSKFLVYVLAMQLFSDYWQKNYCKALLLHTLRIYMALIFLFQVDFQGEASHAAAIM